MQAPKRAGMPKVLIFTGAPSSATVSQAKSSELLSGLLEPVARFARSPATILGPAPAVTSSGGIAPSPLAGVARWRSLPLEKNSHLPTGFSQLHDCHPHQPPRAGGRGESSDFFTTASLSFASSEGAESNSESRANHAVLSQFYEHSLAVHDEISSAQLLPNSNPGDAEEEDSTSFLTEDATTSFHHAADLPDEGAPRPPPALDAAAAHLSDLDDIPNAAYLTRVRPQTVTVNLIVGVISVSALRAVTTRWASRGLVEVLVGDESRSGFQITFWLGDGSADAVVAALRVQDVVLLRNVALNVFMGRVYGSSLRRRLTNVHLLYRRRVDADDVGGYYSAAEFGSKGSAHPQLEKTRRVREWVLNFVGTGKGTGKDVGAAVRGGQRPWDVPPQTDDTQ